MQFCWLKQQLELMCGLVWNQNKFQSTWPKASLTVLLFFINMKQHRWVCLAMLQKKTHKFQSSSSTCSAAAALLRCLSVCVSFSVNSVCGLQRATWLSDNRDTQTLTASSISVSVWRTGLCGEVTLHTPACLCVCGHKYSPSGTHTVAIVGIWMWFSALAWHYNFSLPFSWTVFSSSCPCSHFSFNHFFIPWTNHSNLGIS